VQTACVAKTLACRVGHHTWTSHVEGGETYKVCSVCGKTPRQSRGITPAPDTLLQKNLGSFKHKK